MSYAHVASGVLACLVLFGCGCERAVPPEMVLLDESGRPRMELDPGIVDLGEILVGDHEDMVVDIRVVNRGTSPLRIRALNTSCGCTVAQMPPVIQPASEDWIKLRVKPGNDTGLQSAVVTIVSNDPANPVSELPIRWRVSAPITLEPSSVDFGRLQPGETANQQIAIRLAPPYQKAALRLTSSSGLTWNWEDPHDDSSDDWLVVALNAPDLPVGSYTGTVALTSDSPKLEIILPVRWRVDWPVRVHPTAISSGRVSPAQTVECRVWVESEEGKSFRIKSVGTDDQMELESRVVSIRDHRHEIELRLKVPVVSCGH